MVVLPSACIKPTIGAADITICALDAAVQNGLRFPGMKVNAA